MGLQREPDPGKPVSRWGCIWTIVFVVTFWSFLVGLLILSWQ